MTPLGHSIPVSGLRGHTYWARVAVGSIPLGMVDLDCFVHGDKAFLFLSK